MSANGSGTRRHTGALWLALVGLALALALNVYQFVRGERLARDVAVIERRLRTQIAKLSEQESAALQENQQRLEDLKQKLQGATGQALRQARSEEKRGTSKPAGSPGQVSGDLGSVSDEVATNSKELAALKELGQRNYFEFHLTRTKEPLKVSDIRLVLRKTDPKHNRFTVAVLVDDKTVEKKDRTINEPVLLYVSGRRQPYEIVVNEVKKNEVVGYLATPKVKTPRG
jgi:hypothetical protein